jgi:outer membrane usher protein FimD/PapC
MKVAYVAFLSFWAATVVALSAVARAHARRGVSGRELARAPIPLLMKPASIVFWVFMATAVCSTTLRARAEEALHEAMYTVRVNGIEQTLDSPVLQDESGDFYLRDNALDRWHVAGPSAPPTTYRGTRYYPLAAFSTVTEQADRARHVLAITTAPRTDATTPTGKRRSASYLNYDLSVDGGAYRAATGLLDYGVPVGSGVATAQVVAQAAPYQRRIFLFQTSWGHYNAALDQLFRIGDTTSLAHNFESPVRFEGIQLASRFSSADQLEAGASAFSYETGWERPDITQAPIRLGSFMINATASRGISDRFTAQAHIFADAMTKMVGFAGTWQFGTSSQVQVGIGPNSARSPVEFLRYRADFGHLNAQVDARNNAELYRSPIPWIQEQELNIGSELRASLGYKFSETRSLDFSYAAQGLRNSLPFRVLSLGYQVPFGPNSLTIAYLNTTSGGERRGGITTFLTVPLGARHSVSISHDIQPGSPARMYSLQRRPDSKDVGIGYDVDMAGDGSGYDDASLVWVSRSFTSRFQYARFGADADWRADVSGGLVFFNGTHHFSKKLEQRYALTELRRLRVLTITLVGDDRVPIAAGSIVRAVGSKSQWVVGTDGNVSLTGLDAGVAPLTVTTAKGQCSVAVSIPSDLSPSTDLGTQICRNKHAAKR